MHKGFGFGFNLHMYIYTYYNTYNYILLETMKSFAQVTSEWGFEATFIKAP